MSCELSQERDVGITEYMTADLPAFTAILKHRFRDFQVNEVDLQGQEAVLTSLDPPRLPQPLPLRDLTDEAIQSASRSFAALAGAENGKRLTALLHWVKTKHGPKAPQQEPQCAKPEQQQVQQQQQQQQQQQAEEQQQVEQQQVEQQQQQQQKEQQQQQQQQQQQKGQAAVEAAAAAAGAAAATPEPATLSPTEAVEAHPSPQPDPVSSTGNARAAQPSSGPNVPASSLGKRPADILAGPAPPTQPHPGALVGQQSAGCASPQGSGSPWTGVVMDKHGVAYVDLEPLPDRDTRTAVHSFFRHNPEVILLCTHTLTNESSSSSSSSSNNNNPVGQAGGRGRGRGSSQPPANKKARHTNQMSGRGHQQQQQQAADVEPSQAVASADGAVAASLQAAGDPRDTPAAVTAAVADQDAATPAAPSTTVPAAAAAAAGAAAAGPAIQQPLPTVAAASITHTTAPSAGCIRVQFYPPGGQGQQQGRGQGGRGRGRGRGQPADQEWGGGPTKKYVKFVMYKENMDIQVALGSLAQGLYLPRWASPWGYAGSKDKRGVTQQWVTGFKIDPHQLAGLRHSHWCRNIRVGNFSYVAEPIELGQLAGNRFNILLRAVRASNNSPGAPADAQPSALTLRQQLEASCQAIDRHGFVNYFGLQRFGTAGVPTYRVGVALLQGKFSLAVDLIMSEGEPPAGGTSCEAPMKEGAGVAGGTKEGMAQPEMGEGGRPGVDQQQQQQQQAVKPEVIAARKAWLEGRDAAAALEAMPRWMVGERAMLDALAKSATFKKFRQTAAAKRSTAVTSGASPESLTKFMVLSEELAVEALCAIPRTLRLLYLHAWQSRVWNLAASYRIRVYGSQQAVAGDLVIPLPKEGPPGPEVQALLRSAEVPAAADCDADASAATASTKQTSPPQETEASGDGYTGHTSSARRARGIHVVTEEEARLGLYRIEDVVLPLPGTAVEYPTNNTAEVYRQLTAADGLNLGPGSQHSGGVGGMAAQLGAHELKGDYRRLVLRPTAFTYEVVMYDDPDDDQLMSTSGDSVEAGRPGTLRPPSGPSLNAQQGPVAQSSTANAGTGSGLAARDKAPIVDVAMTEAKPAEKVAPATALPPPPPPPPRLSELEVKQLQEAQAADLGTDGVRRPRLCGLKLSFMLPSSAYATMLIREITRRSTSRAAHQALTWEQQQQQVRQERVKVELVKDEPAAAEPMD